MSSNEYKPIAKSMSEEGVPIAAELIWGLPGDTLAEFEHNLDQLLATFPNINIFGYTLLPGTEFYRKREQYQIEAIPVAGYGKAKGEYVVGCHTFGREEGEEGYFLISAHILLMHGHIMPLTTRVLALRGEVPVSPLFRDILRAVMSALTSELGDLDTSDRMSVYEGRDQIYLAAIANSDIVYHTITVALEHHHRVHGADPQPALQALRLDRALCPRTGQEQSIKELFSFDALALFDSLAAMELPAGTLDNTGRYTVDIHHPGGVGDILVVADGGSWLRGVIQEQKADTTEVQYVAIA
jgi:hypothetical protein